MSRVSLLEKLRVSFKAKVFVLTLSFVAAISLLFPAFFIPYELRDNRQALIRQGTILVNLLAFNSRLPLFSENLALVDEAADSMLIYSGIRSVSVYTADGRKLLDERTGELHLPLTVTPEERRLVVEYGRTLTRPIHVELKDGIEFWAPVRLTPGYESDEALMFGATSPTSANREQTVGVVRLVVDTEEVHNTIALLVAISSAFAFCFIAAGAILAYLMSHSITGPLKRLADDVTEMGEKGGLHGVAVETLDEVGQVAVAFNGVITSLRRREEEKALLEDQLRHSQKLEAVGTLAGGIAHDFNTILTGIVGFTSLLQKEPGNEEAVRQYVGQIRNSADKASRLITRLLAFSRKQVINPRPADLNEIIGNMAELLKRVLSEAVVLELSLEPKPLMAIVDTSQIDQVLLNLAANARDAMPNGGRFVITTRLQPGNLACGGCLPRQPEWCAVITLSDTGTGIPEEIRDKIFDPFFTTKEVGKGTGLGLSMAYGIVRQHGGCIAVEGNRDGGTTFTICLPWLKQTSLPAGGGPRLLDGIPLVIFDNDPVSRTITVNLLEEQGGSVSEVGDTGELIRYCLEQQKAPVVFLDILLSEGKRAYDEIRKVRPDARFVFIAGARREESDDEDALEAGIVTVYRPLDGRELRLKLGKVLQKGAGDAESG